MLVVEMGPIGSYVVITAGSLGTSSALVALPAWEGTYATNLEPGPSPACGPCINRHDRRRRAKENRAFMKHGSPKKRKRY